MTLHAIQRAQERYGLALTDTDIEAIIAMVRNGRTVMTRRMPDQAEVHAVFFLEKSLVALVDPTRQRIVTFFPPQALRPKAPSCSSGKKAHAPRARHHNKPKPRRTCNPKHEDKA